MTRKTKILGILLAGLAVAATPARAAPDLRLEKVVILIRHGIRSPTKNTEELSRYAAETWPSWTVGPGELTAHGARVTARMGAYLRQRYAAAGLLPARGCPDRRSLLFRADSADQRTRASGDALAGGAAPGCGLSAEHAPAGTEDPLFSSNRRQLCAIDAERAKAEILARSGGDLDRPGPDYDKARQALQQVLFPDATQASCTGQDGAKCFMVTAANSLRATNGNIRMEGPLAIGATISESILLEYAEGFPAGAVGWGRAASPEILAAIMPLHDLYADLMRRTPHIASRHSALLVRRIADLLAETPRAGQPRMATFVGHDTNLSNLAGLLDVDWTLPDQPDKTAPDTAMAFEVWRDGAKGERYVRLVVHYQTLEELRHRTDDLHAGRLAESLIIPVAGCDGPQGLCRLSAFTNRLTGRIDPGCLSASSDGE
ncbi:histidine-type phosphatase [Telmatospirillum siberiense]|uniref:Histidine-type phosphatase n=1 Tax=Telmatospirillum siberiense TaxID=382514 RepID=A0A2N3PW14_9PROT|nr:histidine-type phosphatase [Telmatospirillum siberiense]PKU24578.1 hypothetical protein CWS72_10790 [Telmatospirillum siberiense]